MRYFTKEWYNDLLISDMCFQLRKTEGASVFSEAFFKRLFLIEERAYLRYCKRSAKASKAYFDKEAARAEFASNYEENLNFVKANIPDDILADVKDIRVLALGSTTNDIAMRITRFCGKKNRLCESVEKEYDNISEETDEKTSRDVLNALVNINGSSLLYVKAEGDNRVSVSFVPASSLDEKKISLIEAKELENDIISEEMTVIKHELLLCEDGGVEFSLLLISRSGSIHEISYHASEIVAE